MTNPDRQEHTFRALRSDARTAAETLGLGLVSGSSPGEPFRFAEPL